MRIGYVRVSRADQHTEQQETALRAAECEKIFIDHGVSGTVRRRPALDRMLDHLREGDTVVVTKIDRFGRDLHQMLGLVELINERNADIISLAEPEVNTTAAAGKLVFAIFAIVAQFERDRLAERTREGLARTKANGTKLGRPKRLTGRKLQSLLEMREQGWSYTRLAETFDISRSTARKYCEDLRTKTSFRD